MALPPRDAPLAMVDGEVSKYPCTMWDLSPLGTGFSPKKFQSLNVFFFFLCFLKDFFENWNAKGVMKMIFGDEK